MHIEDGVLAVIQASELEVGIRRYELTDHEWAAIKPLLPSKSRGVLRVNDRRVLNGIFWVLRSGAPWRDFATRLRALYHLLQSLRSLAAGPRLDPDNDRAGDRA
jgi:hypothetical protein